MNINPSSGYSNILQNEIQSDVKGVQNSAILEQANQKVLGAALTADQILLDSIEMGGYKADNFIPENSTFSIHV